MLKKKQIIIAQVINCIIIYAVFISNLDKERLLINYKTSKVINHLLPQGWGFFTKNPREPIFELKEINGEMVSAANNTIQNKFGFSRCSRKIGSEVSMIYAQIPKKSLKKEGEIYDTVQITNHKLIDKISKDKKYLFIKREITPWAYYSYYGKPYIQDSLIVIKM